MNKYVILLIFITFILSVPMLNSMQSGKESIMDSGKESITDSGKESISDDEEQADASQAAQSSQSAPSAAQQTPSQSAPSAAQQMPQIGPGQNQNGLLSLDSKIFDDIYKVRQAIKDNNKFEAYRALNSLEQQLLNLVSK
jgi:ABC-type uncharacterized transport system involved in gliding motility auxiliary subunit